MLCNQGVQQVYTRHNRSNDCVLRHIGCRLHLHKYTAGTTYTVGNKWRIRTSASRKKFDPLFARGVLEEPAHQVYGIMSVHVKPRTRMLMS